ncbi:hypothetical protein HQK29_22410 [Vibrio vulnificus]|nr:hypothetical protein [Vibrio vulnificus]
MLGLLGILGETKLDNHQQNLVHTAKESGELLLSIINDILDFSRMEANTLILYPRPFELKSCVEEIVNSFEPLAKTKGFTCLSPSTMSVTTWWWVTQTAIAKCCLTCSATPSNLPKKEACPFM